MIGVEGNVRCIEGHKEFYSLEEHLVVFSKSRKLLNIVGLFPFYFCKYIFQLNGLVKIRNADADVAECIHCKILPQFFKNPICRYTNLFEIT